VIRLAKISREKATTEGRYNVKVYTSPRFYAQDLLKIYTFKLSPVAPLLAPKSNMKNIS
jgi:hypothetical protein